VAIKQNNGDQWKLISTENWPHDPRFRNFLAASSLSDLESNFTE
jgi:hypothetical protein